MDADELADKLLYHCIGERDWDDEMMALAAAELRRLKALEKDAMRYQHIRNYENARCALIGPGAAEKLDAAIDAAMEAK